MQSGQDDPRTKYIINGDEVSKEIFLHEKVNAHQCYNQATIRVDFDHLSNRPVQHLLLPTEIYKGLEEPTKGDNMGEDILIRFDSLTVNEEGQKIISSNREAFKLLASQLDKNLPSGRLKSLVLTKLEEAAMFATKAISHR